MRLSHPFRFISIAGVALGCAVLAAAGADPSPARLKREKFRKCEPADVQQALVMLKIPRYARPPIKSQIIKEDANGLALFDTANGPFWAPKRNTGSLPQVIGEVDSDVYTTEEHPLPPNAVVLDCGANVGVFTRHVLSEGASKVVAIEIAPENIECLRRNFAKEIAAGKVIVYPKGVWDKDDTLTLTVYDNDSGSNTVALHPANSEPGPKVPLTTIDKIVAELKLDRVDFIKMDIEGSERRALRGGIETIRRFRPHMAISVEHGPRDAEGIPALIHRLWPAMEVEYPRCTLIRTDYVTRIQPSIIFAK